jgi:hypothetical protein
MIPDTGHLSRTRLIFQYKFNLGDAATAFPCRRDCESIIQIRLKGLFTTENTNGCTDAGGRATHGAVAEDTEKIISLIEYIKNSVFSAIAPALPTRM